MNPRRQKILANLGISYIKKLFGIIHGPVFTSIFFTRKCDLNCKYCSTSKSRGNTDISIESWKKIINFLHNQGCRFITIYGGEPTLRDDLPELLKHCIDLNMFTHLVTNGSKLNKELLEEFASYGYFLLGLSIDSLSDTNFSPKKYSPELIELLSKTKEHYPENIDYSIHIVITKENIKELVPLIQTINSKLDCRFSLDPVHSATKSNEEYAYRSFCSDLLLDKHDIIKLKNVIQNLKRHRIQIWSPNSYYHYMSKWYQKSYNWKCDAGDLYFAVDNDGSIMLCEDVKTNIHFYDYLKLSPKKRVETLKTFKFSYCNCFKPCYWNPSQFIKHPIKNFLDGFRFK